MQGLRTNTHTPTHTKPDALSKAGNGLGELHGFAISLPMPARGGKREPTLLTTH